MTTALIVVGLLVIMSVASGISRYHHLMRNQVDEAHMHKPLFRRGAHRK